MSDSDCVNRPRILLFVYNNPGCDSVRFLAGRGEKIVGVVTHRDQPSETKYFDSVAQVATDFGLRVFLPRNPNARVFIERLRNLRPDIILSVFFRRILSSEVLALAPLGAFNIHASLLPHYRGRCPLNWVLINGEKETGATLHVMTEEVDAGDIIASRRVSIEPEDDASTLLPKIRSAAQRVLEEEWETLKRGTWVGYPQDHTTATCFPGRTPADGLINWDLPSQVIKNLIRGVTYPFPGAFTWLGGTRMIIWQASTGKDPDNRLISPGTILPGGGIGTGDGVLLPEKITLGDTEIDGKRLEAKIDAYRGTRCRSKPHEPMGRT